jgi:CO dehydrogenase maturation factor
LLGQLESDDDVIVADFEAGIGTMIRLPDQAVDVVIVVVEPTAKSIEVASRAAGLARERGISRLFVVANRLTDDADTARVLSKLQAEQVLQVPEDPAVASADRAGTGVIEGAADGVAVAALRQLADWVTAAA